jgi:hypothetical protein
MVAKSGVLAGRVAADADREKKASHNVKRRRGMHLNKWREQVIFVRDSFIMRVSS